MKPSQFFPIFLLLVTSCAPTVLVSTPTPLPSTLPVPTVQVTATAAPVQISVCTGVTDGKLNVRAGANSQATVLSTLDEGTVVELSPNVEAASGWLAIQSPFAGWVKARFLCGVSK